MPRSKLGTAVWEARTLLLCYAVAHEVEIFSLSKQMYK